MEGTLFRDFYAELGVPRDADAKAIKARFRQLARDRHPDRFTGEEKAQAEQEFQNLTEAFNNLMDPVRRRQVDLWLAQPKESRHDPTDVLRVYLNRGIRAYKQGQWIEAANNFDRATATDPQNPQAWHHLALTCVREPRWLPKAREAIDRACELNPTSVAYLKLAGKIYAQSEMTSRARQYYNQALKLADNDASIRKALKELSAPAGTTAADAPDAAEAEAPGKPKSGLFRKIW